MITHHNARHGTTQITPQQLDWAIEKYLPTSLLALRTRITEETGIDYHDLENVSDCLIILADMNAPDSYRADFGAHRPNRTS